jgi:hypothetical protein
LFNVSFSLLTFASADRLGRVLLIGVFGFETKFLKMTEDCLKVFSKPECTGSLKKKVSLARIHTELTVP